MRLLNNRLQRHISHILTLTTQTGRRRLHLSIQGLIVLLAHLSYTEVFYRDSFRRSDLK